LRGVGAVPFGKALSRSRRGSQVVRQRSAKPLFGGSIPPRASNNLAILARLAQVADQGLTKEGRNHLIGFSRDLPARALLNQSLIDIRRKGYCDFTEICFPFVLSNSNNFSLFHATSPQAQNFVF
jgi:hypothetical protein